MAAPRKRKLADLSVDEFLTSGFDSDLGDDDDDDNSGGDAWVLDGEDGVNGKPSQNGKAGSNKKANLKSKLVEKNLKKGKASQHKDQLSRLKEKDPEFYKFLEENDRTLLNFDDSDSSDEDLHVLPEKLEEASDEDDSDDEEKEKATKREKFEFITVTLKMVEQWKQAAERQLSPRLFHEITQAFKACVVTAKGDAVGIEPGKFKVIDSTDCVG